MDVVSISSFASAILSRRDSIRLIKISSLSTKASRRFVRWPKKAVMRTLLVSAKRASIVALLSSFSWVRIRIRSSIRWRISSRLASLVASFCSKSFGGMIFPGKDGRRFGVVKDKNNEKKNIFHLCIFS
jgi:hypothetical protein